MKRLSFITVLFAILAFNFGCHDGHTGENCIDENPYFEPEPVPESGTLNLSFYPNSKITTEKIEDTFTLANIVEGDKIVFRYNFTDDPYPMAIDDEIEIDLIFEVASNKEEFLISGNDLKRANAMYGNLCFCSPAGYFPITSGCIKGEKISDYEWQIDINILAEKDETVFSKMISDRFEKQ